jgi:hypothetical protein
MGGSVCWDGSSVSFSEGKIIEFLSKAIGSCLVD